MKRNVHETKWMAFAFPKIGPAQFDLLQSIRKIHDPKGYSAIAPHCTLLSTTLNHSKEEFRRIVIRNLVGRKKFQFAMRTALVMPPLMGHTSWYAFLIPDEGFSDLSDLNRRICRNELQSESNRRFPFLPHITLGSFDQKESCCQIVNEINRKGIEVSGNIDSVSLGEAVGHGVDIFDEIRLRGSKNISPVAI